MDLKCKHDKQTKVKVTALEEFTSKTTQKFELGAPSYSSLVYLEKKLKTEVTNLNIFSNKFTQKQLK